MFTMPLLLASMRLPVTEMLPKEGFFTGNGPIAIEPPVVALTGSPLMVAVGAMLLFTMI